MVSIAACGDIAPPGSIGPSGPSRPDATSAPASDTGVAGDLPLDNASREILDLLEPDEDAQVAIVTTWTDELSRSARAAGMGVEIIDPGSILIRGPMGRILPLLEGVPVTRVTVQEAVEAMRRIPVDRPVIEVPTPGHPYATTGFAGDVSSNIAISSPQRDAMIRTLAEGIQTVDGRPYGTLSLDGGCGSDKVGPSCELNAIGFAPGSAGREDDWSIRASPRTGLGGAIDGSFLSSVPRPLVRAAEWAARHDDAALAKIRTYETCCRVSWDPARPGEITLVYERLCKVAVRFDRDLAETGVCVDELSIAVDLRSGAVVSIVGPSGT